MSRIVGRQEIRASAALTTSYVAAVEVDVYSASTIVLLIAYTMGAAEAGYSIIFKVEWSDEDGTTYWQDANCLYNTASIATGAVTVDKTEYTYGADSVAETYDRIALPVPVLGKKVKVSIKETGVAAAAGTCSIKILLLEEI